MCHFDYKLDGNTISVFLSGRMDSLSAPNIQKEMNDVLDATPGKDILIDLEKIDYIASAGLRVFLQLRKKYPSLQIINVTPAVYDIFDMTGFTQILAIRKAFRRIEVDNCEVIGRGANGVIYRIDPETIVKTYKRLDVLDDIRREQELARKAFVLGVPTAISYDIVRVGDGYGAVYELLNATSIAQILAKEPDKLDECVKWSTDLLKIIHSTIVSSADMPDIRMTVLGWVDFLEKYLPEDAVEKLRKLIRAVPDDPHMIHGDYHVKNVMIQNGEALLIDMDTLAHGHPVFELAFINNAYCGFAEMNMGESSNFLSLPHDLVLAFWKKQLQIYLGTDNPEQLQKVEQKARLIGFIRLLRFAIRKVGLDNEQGKQQAAYATNQILELLDKVDSLTF